MLSTYTILYIKTSAEKSVGCSRLRSYWKRRQVWTVRVDQKRSGDSGLQKGYKLILNDDVLEMTRDFLRCIFFHSIKDICTYTDFSADALKQTLPGTEASARTTLNIRILLIWARVAAAAHARRCSAKAIHWHKRKCIDQFVVPFTCSVLSWNCSGILVGARLITYGAM